MKKFKFSLQPLRVLLERQEQTALMQYAQAVTLFEQAKTRLQTINRELDAAALFFESKLRGNCSAAELGQIQDYCRTVERDKKVREREVQSTQSQMQMAFAKLLAARKASMVVNRYYEIQKQHYARACRKEEQKVVDDLNNRQCDLPLQPESSREPAWN